MITGCKLYDDHIHVEGILPKGPYLPCVSMAGRAILAGYPRCMRQWIDLSLALDPTEQNAVEFEPQYKTFSSEIAHEYFRCKSAYQSVGN